MNVFEELAFLLLLFWDVIECLLRSWCIRVDVTWGTDSCSPVGFYQGQSYCV